jgi:hypothetical protein
MDVDVRLRYFADIVASRAFFFGLSHIFSDLPARMLDETKK